MEMKMAWFAREPSLQELNEVVAMAARQMQRRLDLGEDLECETFTVVVPGDVNPQPVKRALEERLHDAGIEVEVDIDPVGMNSELMVTCIGTMGPNPSELVG